MKSLKNLFFPVAVTTMLALAVTGPDNDNLPKKRAAAITISADTVIYPHDGYRIGRRGDFELMTVVDTSNGDFEFAIDTLDAADTLPKLTARDTISVPDSLKDTDPFRYKYYVALLDSATHILVRDSLLASYDTLMVHGDTLMARLDSIDRVKLDSLYTLESALRAAAAFEAWYNSLSPEERKKYDKEKQLEKKVAEADSVRKAKEEKKAVKDSILANTPRVLETYWFPQEMQYKRLVAWQADQDFQRVEPFEPDTTFNYHYYDYPFQRKEVNASWLGVAGSPVEPYNWFGRGSTEGVEFYKTSESWSVNPSTILNYNSKTPYTELCYFGTLFSNDKKESDNLHIFTTQNITPEFNFSILYDLFGGGGILENEKTSNKTFAVATNYVGRDYLMHAGFISNSVSRGENGGVVDTYFIRDTAGLEAREINVNLKNASSLMKKKTFFLDQQYRLPLDFFEKADTSETPALVDRDAASLFIGHSSEYSTYSRKYSDSDLGEAGINYFNSVFNINPNVSNDSLGVTKIDNRIFAGFQPGRKNALVSRIDAGIGDRIRVYADSTPSLQSRHRENDIYLYGGARGNITKAIRWDASAHLYTIGTNAGDFDINAALKADFYPFRKARKSPVSLGASFTTELREPDFYQKSLYTNHFMWNNADFSKALTTKLQANASVPRWGFDAMLGYALLSNNIYYDPMGMARQNTQPMSVLTASLHKDLVVANLLHLDNKVLFQHSTNKEVLPLPAVALNLRYYLQFIVKKEAMTMQVGANAFWNTKWNAPGWNPVLGVFHNQTDRLYNNGPFMDVFINMQWKKAVVFVKYQNLLKGWPMEKPDYFSADRFIITQDGAEGLKIGIWWPFYTDPAGTGHTHSH